MKRRRFNHLTLVVVTLAVGCAVQATATEEAFSPLSPLAFLNRCYSHLTQRKLPLRHPDRVAVSEGVSPVDICMRILDNASLHPSGPDEGKLIQINEESKAVLRTFNDLHRTWFPRDDFKTLTPDGISMETQRIMDSGESALHVTRASFTEGVPFSEITTGDSAMEALRSGGVVDNASRLPETTRLLHSDPTDRTKIAPLQSEMVQFGELLGIRRIVLNPAKLTTTVFSIYAHVYLDPIKPYETLGGGILGTNSYLMLNLARNQDETMDGGIKVARGFSKSVLKDFLCREIPVVRFSDARAYVQTNVTATTPAFRKSATCMTCHSSMDPLGGVVRNLTFNIVPYFLTKEEEVARGRPFGALYHWPVTLPRQSGQADSDVNFHKRPPSGRLFFRDYQGELKNISVSNVAELGKTLSETEDLYVCAASRYFEYFTGVRVSLHDLGDPSSSPLTDEEKQYRELVVSLGREFKTHQNVKTLIRTILESPVYSLTGLRDFDGKRR